MGYGYLKPFIRNDSVELEETDIIYKFIGLLVPTTSSIVALIVARQTSV